MQLSEEKELIKQAQKDPEVFGRIFDEYYSKIFGFILKRTGNLEIAQDITSETFFKALKKLWQFQWRNAPFSSWLYKIAVNEINYFFRKGKYKTVSLEFLQERGFDPTASRNPQAELIEAEEKLKQHKDFLICREQIGRLGIKYQEVVTLRFFEKKQIKEISEILGKAEGTVKSLLHRGLEKLCDAMQPFGENGIIDSERSKEPIAKETMYEQRRSH
ncbi:MAG: RNA polymerase sigma factor [Patescibacteria group bacterium]